MDRPRPKAMAAMLRERFLLRLEGLEIAVLGSEGSGEMMRSEVPPH